jgi:hypothetical protein
MRPKIEYSASYKTVDGQRQLALERRVKKTKIFIEPEPKIDKLPLSSLTKKSIKHLPSTQPRVHLSAPNLVGPYKARLGKEALEIWPSSEVDLNLILGVYLEKQSGNTLPVSPVQRPAGSKSPKAYTSQSTEYERDPEVKKWILLNSQGICECCNEAAPFIAADGSDFLEIHHVKRLADGGSDTTENAVAVCPNCHRELHHGCEAKMLVDELYKNVDRLVFE